MCGHEGARGLALSARSGREGAVMGGFVRARGTNWVSRGGLTREFAGLTERRGAA